MYTLYKDKINNFTSVFWFIKKRIIRIFPLHLLLLNIFLLLEFLKYFIFIEYGISPNGGEPFTMNNFQNYLSNLFLLHSWIDNFGMGSFNYPSWSISVEFFLYIGFSVLLSNLTKSSYIKFLFFLIGMYFLYSFASNEIIFGSISFILGIFASYFKERVVIVAAPFMSFAANFFIILIIFSTFELKFLNAFFLLMVFLFFNYSTFRKSNGHLSGPEKIADYLGNISYSIYMWHALVIWIFTRIYEFINPGIVFSGTIDTLLLLTIVSLAVLTVSSISYKYLELKFLNKKNV